MRSKIIVITLVVFVCVTIAYAADVKWTALAELTAVADADVLCIVDDVAGTATSKKITVLNLFDTIDTFAELNTIVADKTLVNEEDAVGWDALGTFNLGITITTGDPFTLGTNRIDDGSDLLDGEMIANDTIDNNSIDWGDMTDLTTDGAVSWGNIAEGELADSTVVTGDIKDGTVTEVDLNVTNAPGAGEDNYVLTYNHAATNFTWAADADSGGATAWDDITNPDANDEIDFGAHVIELNVANFQIGDGGANYVDFDGTPTITFAGNADIDLPTGSVDLVDLVAGVYAKDLVTTAPITGAADNIFVGADSDVTVALTLLKDIVTTAPITGGEDDVLPGADADLTIALTLLKDLVTTAPVTGGTNDIFPGADADITVALDFTAAWDFGGATSLEIPNADDPDVDAVGEITQDANGAGEANDVSLRGFDGVNQFLYARKLKTIQCTIIKPNDLADATRDACPIWSNETGMTFTVWKIEAWSDTDDTVLNVEEEDADGANNASVDELTIATDGTGMYYTTETTITGATIEASHILLLDFDDTDDPGWVKISICGWFNADVD